MKRYLKYILLISLIACTLVGCQKEKEKKVNIQTEYIYNKLPDSKEEYSDDVKIEIQEKISSWAGGFLLVDSEIYKENQEIIDNAFYQSIVSTKTREKVKKDREAFYQDATIIINNVSTLVGHAYKINFQDSEYGKVQCIVTVEGTRNNEPFKRIYNLGTIVKTEKNAISVYEIGEITWQ